MITGSNYLLIFWITMEVKQRLLPLNIAPSPNCVFRIIRSFFSFSVSFCYFLPSTFSRYFKWSYEQNSKASDASCWSLTIIILYFQIFLLYESYKGLSSAGSCDFIHLLCIFKRAINAHLIFLKLKIGVVEPSGVNSFRNLL